MGSVPTFFRKSGDSPIASYSFTDIVQQVGYLEVLGIDVDGPDYFLVTAPLYGNTGLSNVSWLAAAGADQLRLERDFDLTFTSPQYVKGDLFVNLSYLAAGGGSNCSVYSKVTIINYDGATETTIGTQTTTDTLSTTATFGLRPCVKFNVDKQFKANEILRVNVEVWASSAGNASCTLYHDGANRDFGSDLFGTTIAIPTTFNVLIPLKIDL